MFEKLNIELNRWRHCSHFGILNNETRPRPSVFTMLVNRTNAFLMLTLSFVPINLHGCNTAWENKGDKFLKKLWCCVGGEYYVTIIRFHQLGWWCELEIRKLTFRALALRQSESNTYVPSVSPSSEPWNPLAPSKRRTNVRNDNFRISLQWPIHIIHPLVKPNYHERTFGILGLSLLKIENCKIDGRDVNYLLVFVFYESSTVNQVMFAMNCTV